MSGLARRANLEDSCSGRFWVGRYKSQALLDEKALAACKAYVDLNPLRAKMAKTSESSKYTSVYARAKHAKKSQQSFENPDHIKQQPINLYPFAGNPRKAMPKGLPFKCRDHLELLDWTGRQIRAEKRGI